MSTPTTVELRRSARSETRLCVLCLRHVAAATHVCRDHPSGAPSCAAALLSSRSRVLMSSPAANRHGGEHIWHVCVQGPRTGCVHGALQVSARGTQKKRQSKPRCIGVVARRERVVRVSKIAYHTLTLRVSCGAWWRLARAWARCVVPRALGRRLLPLDPTTDERADRSADGSIGDCADVSL